MRYALRGAKGGWHTTKRDVHVDARGNRSLTTFISLRLLLVEKRDLWWYRILQSKRYLLSLIFRDHDLVFVPRSSNVLGGKPLSYVGKYPSPEPWRANSFSFRACPALLYGFPYPRRTSPPQWSNRSKPRTISTRSLPSCRWSTSSRICQCWTTTKRKTLSSFPSRKLRHLVFVPRSQTSRSCHHRLMTSMTASGSCSCTLHNENRRNT